MAMQSSGRDDEEPVAWLLIDDLYSSTDTRIPIYPNEQFFLGRHADSCRYSWSDSRISNKHLRIHCIQFDDLVEEPIPLVYVEDLSSNGTVVTSSQGQEKSTNSVTTFLHGPPSGALLLTHGDEIIISGILQLVFMEKRPCKTAKANNARQAEEQQFSDRYVITNRKLGSGGQGAVYVALEKASWRQLACKVITLRKPIQDLREEEAEKVDRTFREFSLLKSLSHPNIVTIEKAFWSSNTMYIFQELLTGGDLFSYIEFKGNRVVDVEAAMIARQILEAVKYLHGVGIVHRDLKPDNILLTSLDEGARIVLTDFGSSRFLPQSTPESDRKLTMRARMFSTVGTTEFAAPEIHGANPTIKKEAGYSLAADMWSVGCILAALLSGDTLFVDRQKMDNQTNMVDHVVLRSSKCNLDALDNDPIWKPVGRRPKDLIRKLLVLKEDFRLTAAQALAHPWFTHRSYAAELDALYDRAIRTWQFKKSTSQLVEHLKPVKSSSSPFFFSSTAPSKPRQTTMQKQLSKIEEGAKPADPIEVKLELQETQANRECPLKHALPLPEDLDDISHVTDTPVASKRRRASSQYDEGITDLDMQHASVSDVFKKKRVTNSWQGRVLSARATVR